MENKKMKKMNKKGFTLVEIMIVVAIIGLLAAIGIPSFQKARANSIAKAKQNNIRIITAAVEQWAMENAKADSDTVVWSEAYEYIKGASAASDLTSTTGPLAVGDSVPTLPTVVSGTASYGTSTSTDTGTD